MLVSAVRRVFGVRLMCSRFAADSSSAEAPAAWDAGLHDDYVFPVEATGGTVKRDEAIRSDTTSAKLAALSPAFQPASRYTLEAPGLRDPSVRTLCPVARATRAAVGKEPSR